MDKQWPEEFEVMDTRPVEGQYPKMMYVRADLARRPTGDKRKECCQKSENLVAHQERPDLVVRKCSVCGCRHFELTADKGILGLKGQSL